MSATAGITLATRIESAPGVTGARAAALRKLGVKTIADLLRHLPTRHELERAEAPIEELAPDAVCTARGEITATRVVLRGRKRFEAVMADESLGRLDLTWYHQPYLKDRIAPGMRLRVTGKTRRVSGGLQMVNPGWEVMREGDEPKAKGERLRPVYPASEDLASWEIERVVGWALGPALALLDDHLPPAFVAERNMPTLREAYRMMHAPRSEEEVGAARRRLAYDELLLLQLAVHMKRAHVRRTMKAPALAWTEEIDRRIRARLPFALTPGQDAVVREVAKDLGRPTPANRLIQGDVGSGKTVVALYAMLLAAAGKRQSALMAPTTLLAEQHFASISRLLEGSRVQVALLTGSVEEDQRRRLLRAIADSEIDIVIGTHALLTERVRFASLAVAVIDEQHRFGVHQRATLREKADDPRSAPHVLVMTATPIPRTLSLTVFGDLDVSTIAGLPPGRTPVATRVVGPDKWDEVYAYVRKRAEKGEQAYIVAPEIGADGRTGAADVRTLLRRLESGPLAGLRLAAMHGKLKRETREAVMERFRAGRIDALVATTVIEVGVDVPNATVMVIEGAERFGLAQLHQLRGRVGRGGGKSLCVLLADEATATPEAVERLRVIASTTDGFRLAEKDLEIRGPGETIGTRQSGIAPFRVARFPTDTDLLLMARRDAAAWIDRSPTLAAENERLARSRVLKAHGSALGLAEVA